MAKVDTNFSFWAQYKLSKSLGVLLISLSFLILGSIVSYLLYFKSDYSFFYADWKSLKATQDYKVLNWFNKFGCYIGFVLVEKLFGVLSVLLGLYMFVAGLSFLLLKKFMRFVKTFLKMVLSIFLGCYTLEILNHLFRGKLSILSGNFGNVIAGNSSWVYQQLGIVGVLLVYFMFCSLILVLFYNFDFGQFFTPFKPRNKAKEASKPSEQHVFQDTLLEENQMKVLVKEEILQEITSSHTDSESNSDIDKTDENHDNFTIITPNLHDDSEDSISELSQETESTSESINTEINQNYSLDLKEIDFEITHSNDSDRLPEELEEEKMPEIIETTKPYDPRADLSFFKFPSVDLLEHYTAANVQLDEVEINKNKNEIIETLKSFGVEISSIKATIGPTITLFEITPASGVRISKIINLENDIALKLAALGIRIIAPIPGKGTIGIEVPSKNKQIVGLKSILSSEKFRSTQMDLPLALGRTISNDVFMIDLAKMPHLLMAGATGQGKSVGINVILLSLLYQKHPAELKLVLIDPKKVELSIYEKIEKHYLAKLPDNEDSIITDVSKVVRTMNSLCIEMDNRLDLLKKAAVRNLKEYNHKFIHRQLNPHNGHRYLQYIVVVIDEFADLIMTAGRDIEAPVARIAQLARAVGIHLIIATQRPSVNVITGSIKANFPARISFKVSSMVDSKTILDGRGAEQLVGQGDMLISTGNDVVRVQCAYVDTAEVDRVSHFVSQQQSYAEVFALPEVDEDSGDFSGKSVDKTKLDEMFYLAAKEVILSQNGSSSWLQRKFEIGFNRAAKIMDQLEAVGVVGPVKGSKPREVYIQFIEELDMLLNAIK